MGCAPPQPELRGTLPAPRGAGSDPGAPPRARNAFVDAVRAIAIVRVVVLHTIGGAVTYYIVAAMPAMFFCGGAMAAGSFERRRAIPVLRSRFRRLLVPLWAFSAMALGVMAMASMLWPRPDTSFGWRSALLFAFPISTPIGSEWGTWLWPHLWYLTAYLHLLLLTPLLLRWFRRTPVLALGTVLLLFAVLEWGGRDGWDGRLIGVAVPWEASNLLLFGGFWLLGFGYHDGWFRRLGTTRRAELAVVAAATAVLWWRLDSLRDSSPLLLLVGVTWLLAFLAIEAPLATLAGCRGVRHVVAFLNQRAVTIYLWHMPAIGLVSLLLGLSAVWSVWAPVWADWWWAPYLAGAATFTFIACLLVGWLEDIAARRKVRLLPAGDQAVPVEVRLPTVIRPHGEGAASVSAGFIRPS